MLEQVHDALWVAEGEIVSFFGIAYPMRSVVARLESGDLWVWSPIRLTAALRAEVDRLGPVRHLVSPNKLHHLYLQEWKTAYPKASLWGPQSTIRKRPDLAFREALKDSPPLEMASRHRPGPRAARMATVVRQPCTGAPGARQDPELVVRARHRGPRRVAARERECLPC